MKQVNNIEYLSRSELDALQSERLVKQVKYMYANSPVYRRKMQEARVTPADIKSMADITKLPFVDKTDFRDNYPLGLLCVPRSEIVRIQGSSGTTGKLTVSAYTRHDLEIWDEVVARCLVMAGCTHESTVHVAYGYGIFTGGLGLHGGATKIGATVLPVSGGNTARQIMLMKDFEADILCCTPSYACYIAEELERSGVTPDQIPLKSGLFGAEPWTEGMRLELERKLGINAFDIYGLCEIIGPGVSSECSEHDGLHVWEDHFVPEILDPDTLEPLADGEEGELVFSAITKTGMPVLRYRTHDICRLYSEPCKCGRTHKRMSKIAGRTDDMLIIRGINVFPSQIESVLIQIGGDSGEITPNYQLVVTRESNLDKLTVRVEVSEAAASTLSTRGDSLRAKIARKLANVLGLSATIEICLPQTLPRSEGKAKRIIDQRSL